MKRLATTIVLLVVLGGLGAYIYFDLWNAPVEDTNKKEKVFPGLEFDKLTELKVKSESGDVTTLKKSGDSWEIVAPIATKGSATDVTPVASAMPNLEITRVIEEKAADLKQYGLDLPAIQVDYKLSDGKGGGIQIGQKTSTQAGLYAKRVGDDRVFIIPSYEEGILNKSTFDLRDKKIVTFEREKVQSIDVTLDGKPIELTKDGTDWKMSKPVVDRADTSAVNNLMDKLDSGQMKMVAATDPSPADLKKFGLDKPEATITLNQGATKTTLLVGGKADDMSVYVRDPSAPVVVTIEKTTADELKKVADDYRRRDLFDFRPFNAMHVEFARKGQTIVFERVKAQKPEESDKWKRISPNPADVDKGNLETMLGDFTDLRVTSFVEGNAKTGLDAPALVVTAKFGDDNKEEKVSFGQNGPDVYASRPGASGPGKVDASRYNDAVKKLDELVK